MAENRLQLELLDERRGGQLLTALDERFMAFTETLPKGLIEFSRQSATYGGQAMDKPFAGPSDMNPQITSVPWLFWEMCSTLPDDRFLQLAEAGVCMSLAGVLLDHIVDRQLDNPGPTALYRQQLLGRAFHIYQSVFASKAKFWEHFYFYLTRHAAALSAESGVQSAPQTLDWGAFVEISRGKVAPNVIGIAAFLEEIGEPDAILPIQKSKEYSYVAGQIFDDVLDWRSDIEENHLTFFNLQLRDKAVWDVENRPDFEALERKNNQIWSDVDYLKIAATWFDEAIAAVAQIECRSWIRYLTRYKDLVVAFQKSHAAAHLQIIFEELNTGSRSAGGS